MKLQAAASAAAFQALLCLYWLLPINTPAAHSHISSFVNAQQMLTSFADAYKMCQILKLKS
jgi:methionine-rich copper-binding protein CopC